MNDGKPTLIDLQFWFLLTPIVYPPTILSERIRGLLMTWNPMAPLMAGYQNIVLIGRWPEPPDHLAPAILAAVSLIAGFFAFQRLSGELVDEL